MRQGRQRGYLWTAGSRDEAVPPLTGIAGRLERALCNFIETFPLFAAAVLIAHVTNTHSWMTEWGVQLYFGARVGYLCGGCISLALTRVERGDPRDRDGALVTRSERCVCRRSGILQSIGPVVE
jgi:uncharacterized MAPEG superfamily protein